MRTDSIATPCSSFQRGEIMTRLSRCTLSVILALTAGACGSSSSTSTTTTGNTEWTGTLVGSGTTSGSLSLVFSSPVPAALAAMAPTATAATAETTVTGTLRIGGQTIPLAGGAYNATAMTFSSLAGGGYTLSGTVTSTKITGTFTGPA